MQPIWERTVHELNNFPLGVVGGFFLPLTLLAARGLQVQNELVVSIKGKELVWRVECRI